MEDPIRLCMKSQPHPCHGGPIQTVHEEPTTSLPWRTHSPCPQTLRHTGFFAFYPALTTPWWGLGTPVMLFFQISTICIAFGELRSAVLWLTMVCLTKPVRNESQACIAFSMLWLFDDMEKNTSWLPGYQFMTAAERIQRIRVFCGDKPKVARQWFAITRLEVIWLNVAMDVMSD